MTWNILYMTILASGIIYIASKLRPWREYIENSSNLSMNAINDEDTLEPVDLSIYHVIAIPISSSITLIIFLYYFAWIQYFVILFIAVCLLSTVHNLISDATFIIYHNLPSMHIQSNQIYPKKTIWLISLLLSLTCLTMWFVYGSVCIHNIMASSLAISFISLVKFPNLKIATFLLIILLIYDVYWVFLSQHHFNTNVMVTVAQKVADNPIQNVAKYLNIPYLDYVKSTIDLPIKLLFPVYSDSGLLMHYSVLGLGDITLPGEMT